MLVRLQLVFICREMLNIWCDVWR